MRSLKELYNDPRFTETKRKHLNEEITLLLMKSHTGKNGAVYCLNQLWLDYDAGGISIGRSFRSRILEQILSWLREDGDDETLQKAKTALSIFVAMHYDYEYINEQKWFDYRLHGAQDIPLRARILASAAAFALEVDEIPSLNDWKNEQILALVNNNDRTTILLNDYQNG